MEFLHKVQWRIVPKPEVLVDYYASLVGRSEGFELEVRRAGQEGSEMAAAAEAGGMDTDPP